MGLANSTSDVFSKEDSTNPGLFKTENSVTSDIHKFLRYTEFNGGCSMNMEYGRHTLHSNKREICDAFRNVVVVYIKTKETEKKTEN